MKAWPASEVRYLQDAYTAEIPVEVIANQLGRTSTAVYQKASHLGITDAKRPKSSEHVNAIRIRVREWWTTLDREAVLRIVQHSCSEETKEKLSVSGKLAYEEGRHVISEEQRQISSDTLKTLQASKKGRFGHPGTGSAGKRIDIGFYVRSRWEANVARILLLCRDIEIFQTVEYEPQRFDFESIKRGVRSYLPDFRVTWPDGQVEYIEVKGWWDGRSKTAVKRFHKYYPDETLWAIDAPVYKELTELFDSMPEWER